MSHPAQHDEVPPEQCANCGTTLQTTDPLPRFCPACGQETRLHPPSFGEFLHEFVGHYVALEGALWRTLGLLLFRPGRLTLEYLRGRRRRYVLPLRVYLTASFVFFLVVKVFSVGMDSPALTEPVVQVDTAELQRLRSCVAGTRTCDAVEGWVARMVLRLHDGPGGAAQVNRTLQDQMLSAAPYAMFAMQPLFAGLVMLAWRRRRLTYGAHFVFSLHLHAFWFLALLAMAALPAGADGLGLPVIAGYTLWAMRTVYGGRWLTTMARGMFVGAVYLLLLVLLAAGFSFFFALR
jgi:hypothetical protein